MLRETLKQEIDRLSESQLKKLLSLSNRSSLKVIQRLKTSYSGSMQLL